MLLIVIVSFEQFSHILLCFIVASKQECIKLGFTIDDYSVDRGIKF